MLLRDRQNKTFTNVGDHRNVIKGQELILRAQNRSLLWPQKCYCRATERLLRHRIVTVGPLE
ncbi:unnamed protein product [Staurois parvus]|uniref:Uncharacterized protein n=1 Tax=Staurois parvus TaxID=386267 RepID=A0ABN9B482_9NEOB|nr:unnamed protein product [Staurois parvus]